MVLFSRKPYTDSVFSKSTGQVAIYRLSFHHLQLYIAYAMISKT